MTARLDKSDIRDMLLRRDLDGILRWARDFRSPHRTLMSLSFDHDKLVRWRAIEAFGKVAGLKAEFNQEKVRDLVRRLFWLMNDESGGLGWHSPELIGEVIYNVPELADEYGILLPAYVNEEPFERGTHIAMSRVALKRPDVFGKFQKIIARSLNDEDALIRGFAALVLGYIDSKMTLSLVEELRTDSERFKFYDFDSGEFTETSVGEMAERAIKKSNSAEDAA